MIDFAFIGLTLATLSLLTICYILAKTVARLEKRVEALEWRSEHKEAR